MDKLLACRVCLLTDVKMFSLKIPQLNNAYFKLTGVIDASSPSYACYECANILLKSEQFRLKCAQANRILTSMVLENSKITKDLINAIDRKKYGLVSNMTCSEQYSIDCKDFDKTKDVMDCKDFEDTKDNIDIKQEVENSDIHVEIDGLFVDKDIKIDVAYEENNSKIDETNKTNEEIDLLDSPKESKKIHKRKQIHSMKASMKDVMSVEKFDQKKAMLEIIDKKNSQKFKKSRASKNINKQKSTSASMEEVMLVEKLNQEKAMLEMTDRKNSGNYKDSNYKCELCFRGFRTIRTYDNHMKKHNLNGRAFECDFCHSVFKTKYRITKHIRTNHKYKYTCKMCPYICVHQTQAKRHVLRHRGKQYPCELCGQVYDYKHSLSGHKKVKHPTPSACDLCGESFSNERGVFLHKGKIHIQEINEKLGPECKTCGVHFASEKAWKRHLIHSSNHQDISGCKVCGDIFVNSEQLEEHLRVSENCELFRKQYRKQNRKLPVKLSRETFCKVCNQRFETYNNCTSHMRKEHPETQYICQICGKAFGSKGCLYKHIRVHNGEKPYKCTKCDKSYTSYGSYYMHNQTHKGLTYECDICKSTYRTKSFLQRHMKRHMGVKPFKCTVCNKKFTERCEVKYHTEYVHMNKPWPKRDRSKIKKEN